uniref:L1 transposable element RRM domain-containing protein n=1 Tax=Astyanax mexicanus TaxID=7994 RepID=A0A3B1JLI8_ASTMX
MYLYQTNSKNSIHERVSRQKPTADQSSKVYTSSRPTPPATRSTQGSSSPASASQTETEATGMMAEAIKSDILSSLREDISKIIKEELKRAFAEDFNSLKSELQAVRLEISSSAAAIRSEVDRMKMDFTDMAGGLSTWSDEVASLQTAVTCLQSQVEKLKEKNEDLEGRMRRGNIRIVGVDEQPESTLQIDRDVKVDRSHRSLTQWKPGDRPRVIIAKLHYDGDAAEILRRARDQAPLSYNGKRIAIYPDYTATVAKARASFTSVRKMLRGKQGIRYGLLFPARLRITYRNEEKEFLDATEALEYLPFVRTARATLRALSYFLTRPSLSCVSILISLSLFLTTALTTVYFPHHQSQVFTMKPKRVEGL